MAFIDIDILRINYVMYNMYDLGGSLSFVTNCRDMKRQGLHSPASPSLGGVSNSLDLRGHNLQPTFTT